MQVVQLAGSGRKMRVTKQSLLYRRNGVFYLRQSFGKTELRLSLRTCSRPEAQARYFVIQSFLSYLALQAMNAQSSITPDQIKTLAHQFFQERFVSKMRTDFDVLSDKGNIDEAVIDAGFEIISDREEKQLGHIPPLFTDYISRWQAGFPQPASLDHHKSDIHELLYRAELEVLQLFIRRLKQGYSGLTIEDPYFKEMECLVNQPINLLRQQMAKGAQLESKTLAVAINDYLTTKTDQESKTVTSYRDSFNVMLDILPDQIKLATIDEDLAEDLLKRVRERPANFTKLHKANKDLSKAKKLSETTLTRHWGLYKNFFEWCVKKRFISHNPLALIKGPNKKASKSDRNPFSHDELVKIFSSPIYTGFKSRKRRGGAGNLICKDVNYWCPLIAYYTGCRPEEILALRLKDVKHEYGIMFLDVVWDVEAGKRLKTESSIRCVPVHNDLLRLGFDKYVEIMRSQGHADLFPDATPSTASGKRSDIYSKRSNYYLRQIGVKTDRNAFYSFRHTFTQALAEGRVSGPLMSQLAGHNTGSITTDVYGGRISITALHEELHKARFQVCVPDLIEERTTGKDLKTISPDIR